MNQVPYLPRFENNRVGKFKGAGCSAATSASVSLSKQLARPFRCRQPRGNPRKNKSVFNVLLLSSFQASGPPAGQDHWISGGLIVPKVLSHGVV